MPVHTVIRQATVGDQDFDWIAAFASFIAVADAYRTQKVHQFICWMQNWMQQQGQQQLQLAAIRYFAQVTIYGNKNAYWTTCRRHNMWKCIALNHVMNEKILSRVRVHRTQQDKRAEAEAMAEGEGEAAKKIGNEMRCHCCCWSGCCLDFARFCHLTGLFILFCYARQTACVKDLTNCAVCVCVCSTSKAQESRGSRRRQEMKYDYIKRRIKWNTEIQNRQQQRKKKPPILNSSRTCTC